MQPKHTLKGDTDAKTTQTIADKHHYHGQPFESVRTLSSLKNGLIYFSGRVLNVLSLTFLATFHAWVVHRHLPYQEHYHL